MGYVTKEELRNLTGLTEVEISDDQLNQIMVDAANFVDAYTGQSWSQSEADYSKVQTAVRFEAISLVYDTLPLTRENNEKAQRFHEKALRLLDGLVVLDGTMRVVQG
ncbi:MAG: hypothetical protein NWF14_06430 [Candidatus Bathyarchaeota archaeon]|nr:hypothetical protein [Candidatus Bathyarchaeota archaeon]